MQRIAIILLMPVIAGILFTKPSQAGRCTRVIQNEGAEFIVNTCKTCRKVNIRRKRRGVAMPVMRTYNIQPHSRFPTSFRGIGRSRISSEVPCEGAGGARSNMTKSKGATKRSDKCVTLRIIDTKNVALVNKCSSCRGVAIERYNHTGRTLGQQVYKMKPLSVISVESKGAAKARYLNDSPCPRKLSK